MARTAVGASARERLLASANELFYEEGVHTVGIDRIIEHAGVAKASLYNTFGSKDELVRAYLQGRQERMAARVTRFTAGKSTPQERILAVFEAQGEVFAEPGFNGCAFAGASAESRPGDPGMEVTQEYRAWVRGLFADLARELGAPQPDLLALQLHLLYDGAGLSARMDHDPAAASAARAAAAILLDAARAADGVSA